jgi:hypothetical protein
LDKIWKLESNRGDPRYMRSGAGALGHFGFMPDTIKEYGGFDPMNLDQSAEASARKFADLKKRYGGNMALAAAAYNVGDGNLNSYRLGKRDLPGETQKYTETMTGVKFPTSLKTEIHVHGVQDPQVVADIISQRQLDIQSDIVRNMSANIE